MTNTTNKPETLKPAPYYNASPFAATAGGRWVSGDKIEVCECPPFSGRSAERRYVAQRLAGGSCAWGPTKEAAANAVRQLAE